ncbi:MAG: ATP-binding protein [Pirellulales bacterium]
MEQIRRLNRNSDEEDAHNSQLLANELSQRLDSLKDPTNAGIQEIRDFVREQVLSEAYSLVERCRQEVAEVNQQNQHVAGLVGTGLAMLGLCGAVAGLLAGYSVAQSVAMSIEQLGGSVQALAETLDDASTRDGLQFGGLRELVAAMTEISSQTAGVVNELEQSRDSAARSDQLAAVGQLAAGIAHELRNPLAAVKLLVDTAVEEKRSLSSEDLLVTQEELSRINQMFASFLDFARPPSLRKEHVDLYELLGRVIQLVQPRAKVQNVLIEFRHHESVPVYADPQQIRQVFLNIFLNALDAQPGGGRIVIDVDQENRAGSLDCVVRISDAGTGISPQVAETLFEPFVGTKETGVGLGLAICRRILESHGGAIDVESSSDGGAQFSVYLPVESTAATTIAN